MLKCRTDTGTLLHAYKSVFRQRKFPTKIMYANTYRSRARQVWFTLSMDVLGCHAIAKPLVSPLSPICTSIEARCQPHRKTECYIMVGEKYTIFVGNST